MQSVCPLCQESSTREVVVAVSKRRFFSCDTCGFLWVSIDHHISVDAERERYLHHNNSLSDPGYRAFLSRLFQPMVTFLAPGSQGLDFGSGPSPTLARMFTDVGFVVDTYDPFFGPYKIERDRYDFITATEVAEHFRTPRKELDHMFNLLSSGGYLGIMTQEVPDDPVECQQWFYFRDPTHVSFFSDRSIRWWAAKVGLCAVYHSNGVWVFRKV